MEGRAEIFSPFYSSRPLLSIPPRLSRVQGPPWGLGPPIFLKKFPDIFPEVVTSYKLFGTIDSQPLYIPWKFEEILTTRFREN